MRNRKIVYLLIALLLGGLGFVFFMLNARSKTHFNWNETYKPSAQQPYDVSVLRTLLEHQFPPHQFHVIENRLAAELPDTAAVAHANYFFIGENLYLDSAGRARLLGFVERGNRAFIASNELQEEIMTSIVLAAEDENYYFHWEGYKSFQDTAAKLSAANAAMWVRYVRQSAAVPYNWRYVPTSFFDNTTIGTPLGYVDEANVNLLRVPYGDGGFYFYTTPLALTNYHLLNSANLPYLDRLVACLQNGDVYWDEVSQLPAPPTEDAQNGDTQLSLSDRSPLEFVLEHQSLTWAWYFLLAMVLLFLAFRAKRRVPPIAVVEPNANTSLEYLDAIGQLYIRKSDHKALGIEKIRLFLHYLRERYRLNTKTLDEAFEQQLIMVSGVEAQKVNAIFKYKKMLEKPYSNFDEDHLIAFHKTLDYFYKNCK